MHEFIHIFDSFANILNAKLNKQIAKQSNIEYVVNALNKGINNPGDLKGHLEGKISITLY